MPVSYLSQSYRPNPYVAPVSLELLAKVLSQKQASFDQNSEKIQNNINSLASLDVARGVDRDYLNNKLNTLVSTINSVGGADLADPSITNQIDGLATSVYNDQNVISAVSSTKRIRNLQNSYDKMKTDPKLVKYWSDANYVNDMESVNSYMGSKDLGASYQGGTSATPFFDYDKEYRDIFSKMVPNEYTYNNKSGYYLDKTTNKEVSPETVMQAARERMSSQARGQMERDANYLYKYKAGYGKTDLVAKAVNDQAIDLQDEKDKQARLLGASVLEQDHTKKTNLLNQLEAQKAVVSNKENALKTSIQDNSKLYDTNSRELMYKVFSNDYVKGLARTYSYKKENTIRTLDPAEKMILEESGRNTRMTAQLKAAKDLQIMKEKGLDARSLMDKQVELAKAGLGEFDDKGNFKFTNASNGMGGKGGTGLGTVSNNSEVKDIDAAVDKAKQRVLALDGDSTDKWTKYAQESFADAGIPFNLEDLDTNGDKKFTGEDLNDWIDINNKIIVGKNIKDEKYVNVLRQLSQAYEAYSKGLPTNITSFRNGTNEMFEQLNFNALEKEALQKNIDLAANRGSVTTWTYDPALGVALPHSVDMSKDNFVIKNYQDKYFDADEKGQKGLGTLKSYISNKEGVPIDNSTIVKSISKDSDGTYSIAYQYKDNNNKMISAVSKSVPSSVAEALGNKEDRSQVLDDIITYDRPVEFKSQNEHDKSFISSFQVYKPVRDLNDKRYKIKYFMDGRYVTVPISKLSSNGSDDFPSAAVAYQTMKKLLSETPLTKTKFEELIRQSTK